MPGLTGFSTLAPASPEALRADLERMTRALCPRLFSAAAAREAGWRREEHLGAGLACRVEAHPGPLGASSGITTRRGLTLAFEGYLVGEGQVGAALREDLLDRFERRGLDCVADLSGSFQFLFQDGERTWLYADPLASRRLFYRHDPGTGTLAFAPEIEPLLALSVFGTPGSFRLDPANLVHLLSAGRCFAGGSPVAGVRQLLPGQGLSFQDGQPRSRRHASYRIEPREELEVTTAAVALEEALEEAILERWRMAERPAILLSGGYDSRYLFHTIAGAAAAAGGDPGRIRTVFWGEGLDRPGSDADIAERCARAAGTRHRAFEWRADSLPELFAASFRAQSGMTDYALSHADDVRILRQLVEDDGVDALFRGDEGFGPSGPAPESADEALASLFLDPATAVEGSEGWFTAGGAEYAAAHEEERRRAFEDLPLDPLLLSPHELRDTLYVRQRLPSLHHHLNYHKAHGLEMINPLLDGRVLAINRHLPSAARVNKTLFRRLFARRFARELEIPIATAGNGIDWPRALRRQPALAKFFAERLDALPPPLDRSFFLARLRDLLADRPLPPRPFPESSVRRRIPREKLLFRAVLIGEWARGEREGWMVGQKPARSKRPSRARREKLQG